MAGRLVIPQYMPARDINGDALPGAKLFVYVNGTTTLAITYTTSALNVPNSNPIIANSSGTFPPIWAADASVFSVALTDDEGAPYWRPYDGVEVTMNANTAAVVLAESAADSAQAFAEEAEASAEEAANAAAFASQGISVSQSVTSIKAYSASTYDTVVSFKWNLSGSVYYSDMTFEKYGTAIIGDRRAPHFASDSRYTNIMSNGLEAKSPDDPVDIFLGRWDTVSGDGLDGTLADYQTPKVPVGGQHLAGIYGAHYPGAGNWFLEPPPGGNWRNLGRNVQLNFYSQGVPTDSNRGGYAVLCTVPQGSTTLLDKVIFGDQGNVTFLGGNNNSVYSSVNLRNGKGAVTIVPSAGQNALAIRSPTDATNGFDITPDFTAGTVTFNRVTGDAGSDMLIFTLATKKADFRGPVAMPVVSSSTSYANDAAAAAGGVAIGQLYRNGSVVQIRVA